MKSMVRSGLVLTVVLILLWVFIPAPTVRLELLPHKPTQVRERTKATMQEKRENKALIVSYSRALGYTKPEVKCLIALWTRESRLDHYAKNQHGSSAFGIAQLLGERSREPELQILHGIRYLEHRYRGSACRALSHSSRRGWY